MAAYDSKEFQKFLDEQQYSRNGILRYEKIFGRDYVSTGGIDTTREFVKMLNLKDGQKVLDIGCGIGGSAFLMHREYGAHVRGIDLSTNMIDIANERATAYKLSNVTFTVEDATTAAYEDASFDVVYSRDTILHIADKEALFSNFYRWLKPGGVLMISDYCCTAEEWHDDYRSYVASRGYNLLSVEDYGKVIEKVGFTNVSAIDKTSQFIEVLKRELEKFNGIKDEFAQEFSQADYDAILSGWSNKVVRCNKGDQKWGLFIGYKK